MHSLAKLVKSPPKVCSSTSPGKSKKCIFLILLILKSGFISVK